jgi:glycerol uptake facilitator-like aquaporin
MTGPQRLTAEALGTGMLVAGVVGSGIMAERLTDEAALALLANTIPTGAILFVLITILCPISGAHFNPAVTLVAALQRALPPALAGAYVLAQICGGVAGTLLAHLMFDTPLLVLGDHVRSGGPQWLSEGVATFGLVVTILAGVRFRPQAIPALVGSYIVAAYWFTASTSFANPAVTIARALTDTFSGIRMLDVPAFIVAQLAGALVALGLCRWLLPREQPT